MSNRVQLVLNTREVRETARNWVNRAPPGTRLEFKGPKRSIDQNDRMWAMLTDIARQVEHNGRKYNTDQWKVLLMHACGREVQFLPALNGGGFVPYGQSSSDLSVAEMADLITFIMQWGDENGVVWSDPTMPRELETVA